MKRLVVLFEDHTVQHLRPLAWSVPAHEIPYGPFNLRERLDLALEDAGETEPSAATGVLVRSVLTEIQALSRPGAAVGPEAVLRAADAADEVVLLSSRLALGCSALAELLETLPAGRLLADPSGPLAWRLASDAARTVVAHWEAWESAAAADGAWTRDGVHAAPWNPADPDNGLAAPDAWTHLWQPVHRIGEFVAEARTARRRGAACRMPDRTVFGALDPTGAPVRHAAEPLHPFTADPATGVLVVGGEDVWVAEDARIAPGVVIDASAGPVLIEAGVRILPHVYLEGPLHLGPGVRVKAGAQIYGETAVGAASRINGEIAESQICAYANKQHAGFLGHAVLGSWTNLGADTTNSDLKNNYGEISVNYGLGSVATGSRFVGLMMAEHAKSAIGTTFNTGTCVGFSSNVFGAGFPRSTLRNYTWGDGRGRRLYDPERAVEVARVVLSRRGCTLHPAQEALFHALSDGGA